MTDIARTKNFLQIRTLTARDIKSFVDIEFKTDSIIRLKGDSPTGYKTNQVYEADIEINSVSNPISVSGSDAPTLLALVNELNIALTGTATAEFVESDQVIRVLANTANHDIEIIEPGSLINGLVGDKQTSLQASFGTPCIEGGVNFRLTNVASEANPVNAGFISKARTSAGADIAVSEVYDNETGVLQVKKASGSFSASDVVTVIGNLLG